MMTVYEPCPSRKSAHKLSRHYLMEKSESMVNGNLIDQYQVPNSLMFKDQCVANILRSGLFSYRGGREYFNYTFQVCLY